MALFKAPSTDVVIPDECQSIPITAPKLWNQNGSDIRRRNSGLPCSIKIDSVIANPSFAILCASQGGTCP